MTNKRDDPLVLLLPKSFDLLLLLAENENRLVIKEMIFEQLWNRQFVEENKIIVRVSELQKTSSEKSFCGFMFRF